MRRSRAQAARRRRFVEVAAFFGARTCLPHHHRDPFDRLLVAQAQVEGLPIVTSDENIARYGVEVIW